MGSLFKGHGLGNQSASELREEFNKNISKNPISKLENINNTFKALYATNPKLAADYEAIIDKADIRQGVESTISGIEKEIRDDKKTGKRFEHSFVNVTHNWTDKEGNPQVSVKQQTVTTPSGKDAIRDVTPAATFAANAVYLRMLDAEGEKQYYGLLKDFEPYQAFMKVRAEHGKSFTKLESEALLRELSPTIATNWVNMQKNYLVTNTMTGAQQVRADIQAYRDNPNSVPKPSDYYNNINEYSKDILGLAMNVDPMNPNNKLADGKTYQVDSELY